MPRISPSGRNTMEDRIDPEVHERHQQRLATMLDADPDSAMGKQGIAHLCLIK
jgi:hypothetical protein